MQTRLTGSGRRVDSCQSNPAFFVNLRCLRLLLHRSIVKIRCRPPSSQSGLRSTQLIQGDAQRTARDFDQPTIRLIHFEHHKDREGKCKRGNE